MEEKFGLDGFVFREVSFFVRVHVDTYLVGGVLKGFFK